MRRLVPKPNSEYRSIMNENVKINVPDEATMTVIYDGECPFCSNFVRFMELQRRLGSVRLIDARSGDPLVAQVQRAGYDLNEGMMAIYGGTTYYGSDALALISAASRASGSGWSASCWAIPSAPRCCTRR